jgi:hypothetical protein
MSVAPTGKRVGFRGISTVRIREGKISENRGMLGLLQQHGAVPAALVATIPGPGYRSGLRVR